MSTDSMYKAERCIQMQPQVQKTAKNIYRDIKLATLKMDRPPINWIQTHNSMDPRLKEYAYDVL